jgi:hypothetical protein
MTAKRENVCDVTQPIWVSHNVTPLPGVDLTLQKRARYSRTIFTMLSIATRRVPATLASRAALVRAYSSGREGSVAQSKEFG